MTDVATTEASADAPSPKLDELMLAMDVVDTIRHEEAVVARELGQDSRDVTLKARLRQLYESQGLTVTEEILESGIKALRESRFAYTPPPPSPARTLAHLWIIRGRVAAIAGIVLAVIFAVVVWQAAAAARDRREAEAERVAIEETLPRELEAASASALAAAEVPDATAEAERLTNIGTAAIARADAGAARAAIADLDGLTTALNATFDLRIAQGVWREPLDNPGAQNFYLIVDAIAPDGDRVAWPVTSEEDGATRLVSRWGVQVPAATYNAVSADYADDGIINNNILGAKPAGQLEPEYAMDVAGGTITEW